MADELGLFGARAKTCWVFSTSSLRLVLHKSSSPRVGSAPSTVACPRISPCPCWGKNVVHRAEVEVTDAVGASLGPSGETLDAGGFVKKTSVRSCSLSPPSLTWVVVNKELVKGF